MSVSSVCPHCHKTCQLYQERNGVDIYGNKCEGADGGQVIECPCCKKSLAATRLAPHLEKCMGMGRQSSRKRNIVKMSQHEEDSDEGVDEVFGALMEGAEDVNDEFANYSQETQKKPKTVSPKKSTTSSSSKPKASSSNNPSSSTNQPSKLSKQSSPVKVPVVQVKKPSNSPTKVRKK